MPFTHGGMLNLEHLMIDAVGVNNYYAQQNTTEARHDLSGIMVYVTVTVLAFMVQ